jgi:hypothetical protein
VTSGVDLECCPSATKSHDGQETDEFMYKLYGPMEDGMKIWRENKGTDSM